MVYIIVFIILILLAMKISDWVGRKIYPTEEEIIRDKISKEARFAGKGLTFAVIPEGEREIEWSAYSCNQLTCINIPSSVRIIGECAFYSNLLTKVTIPFGVKEIEANAFGVNKLTSVVLPSTLEVIGESSFIFNELTQVKVLAITPPKLIKSRAAPHANYNPIFLGNPLQKIIVPLFSVWAYKNAEGWSDYADIIVGE